MENRTQCEHTKVVIDCDPGVDDALALAMAAALPSIDVVGITTVFGNASIDITTNNAAGLVALGRWGCHVARGARRPLVSPFHGGVPQVHGADGLGDGEVLKGVEGADLNDCDAASALVNLARQYRNDLTIIALGPLTNLALASHLDENFAHNVRQIIAMGGNAFSPGNATPTAEANMWNDPEAADIVMGLDCPITMVGLDVTHRVNLTGQHIESIARADTLGGRIARHALPRYRQFFERTNGIDGVFCHDPSAIAYLVRPDLFLADELPIRVETCGFSRGKTWPALGDTDDAAPVAWEGRPPVTVCKEVEGRAVADFVTEVLRSG